MNRPRVLLADDHPFLLKAAGSLLSHCCDVVGTASTGVTLVSEAIRLCPDVIVTDIAMPNLNGIDAVHQLRDAGSRARVIFLTIHSEEEFVNACMAEGEGYVHKSRMQEHLIPAVQAALNGESYISRFNST